MSSRQPAGGGAGLRAASDSGAAEGDATAASTPHQAATTTTKASRVRAIGGDDSSIRLLRDATALAAIGAAEVLAHERDRHASLAEGRGDALHGAKAHVAARRMPLDRPAECRQFSPEAVRTCAGRLRWLGDRRGRRATDNFSRMRFAAKKPRR